MYFPHIPMFTLHCLHVCLFCSPVCFWCKVMPYLASHSLLQTIVYLTLHDICTLTLKCYHIYIEKSKNKLAALPL